MARKLSQHSDIFSPTSLKWLPYGQEHVPQIVDRLEHCILSPEVPAVVFGKPSCRLKTVKAPCVSSKLGMEL
jgi:hypothetical protein